MSNTCIHTHTHSLKETNTKKQQKKNKHWKNKKQKTPDNQTCRQRCKGANKHQWKVPIDFFAFSVRGFDHWSGDVIHTPATLRAQVDIHVKGGGDKFTRDRMVNVFLIDVYLWSPIRACVEIVWVHDTKLYHFCMECACSSSILTGSFSPKWVNATQLMLRPQE